MQIRHFLFPLLAGNGEKSNRSSLQRRIRLKRRPCRSWGPSRKRSCRSGTLITTISWPRPSRQTGLAPQCDCVCVVQCFCLYKDHCSVRLSLYLSDVHFKLVANLGWASVVSLFGWFVNCDILWWIYRVLCAVWCGVNKSLTLPFCASTEKRRKYMSKRETPTQLAMNGKGCPVCATSIPRTTRTRKTSVGCVASSCSSSRRR